MDSFALRARADGKRGLLVPVENAAEAAVFPALDEYDSAAVVRAVSSRGALACVGRSAPQQLITVPRRFAGAE